MNLPNVPRPALIAMVLLLGQFTLTQAQFAETATADDKSSVSPLAVDPISTSNGPTRIGKV